MLLKISINKHIQIFELKSANTCIKKTVQILILHIDVASLIFYPRTLIKLFSLFGPPSFFKTVVRLNSRFKKASWTFF